VSLKGCIVNDAVHVFQQSPCRRVHSSGPSLATFVNYASDNIETLTALEVQFGSRTDRATPVATGRLENLPYMALRHPATQVRHNCETFTSQHTGDRFGVVGEVDGAVGVRIEGLAVVDAEFFIHGGRVVFGGVG
jgi:hypothetical protein